MVERDDDVVRPLARPGEDGVAGVRAADVMAGGAGGLDGRADDADLLVAEEPALAGGALMKRPITYGGTDSGTRARGM